MRTTSWRSAPAYFLLTTALATPVVLIGFTLRDTSGLPKDIPLTDLVLAFVPVAAAAILVYRADGASGVRALIRRAVDHHRITRKSWYLPVLLLMPVLFTISYGIARLAGHSTFVEHPIPVGLVPAIFLLFVLLAAGEEIGHTAYATDALQRRFGAFTTAVLIGVIWHCWHVPSILMQGKGWGYIMATLPLSVATRVLWVWLYNNTGRSAFAVILVHATANLSGTYLQQEYAGPVIVAAALVIVVLARGRYLTEYHHPGSPAVRHDSSAATRRAMGPTARGHHHIPLALDSKSIRDRSS